MIDSQRIDELPGTLLSRIPRPRAADADGGSPGRRPADRRDDQLAPLPRGPRGGSHRGPVAAVLVGVDLVALALPMVWRSAPSIPSAGYVGAALLLLAGSGAYRPRLTLSALDHLPHHLLRLGLALLLMTPLAYTPVWNADLKVHALFSVPCFVLGRCVGYAGIRWARRRRLVVEPTLVVNGGKLAMDLLSTMDQHPEYGLRPVGYLADCAQLDDRAPLGRVADIDAVLDEFEVRTVIVAYGPTREPELVSLMRSAALRDIEIYVVPRFFELGMSPSGPDVEDLWGIPLQRVRRAALRSRGRHLKRLLDATVAGTAMLLLSPLLAALAAAVRLSSPGPVFFRQVRTGRSGRPISILKFRTLRVAAPEPGTADGTGSTRDTMHARRVDVERRQTPIGSFLRATSLDELPQLWNILRGDMSLVGPRPEEAGYAAQFADSVQGYRDRHRLAVGLTGWAQVHGLRGDTSIEERARFDNHYIEHWSLWRDAVILVRTVAAVLRQAVNTARRPARR
ncbi:exopolysaccharide biosynthesis polyprenyl glycosylphosphotransferase [Modestobacter sp. I12A-02662]|uniref:exopolysaccharide biosynthesis polyprenyl glycosylphosphotransferase n=1 Tax=Modestobacter sp. I12A-02662 TaxID=1730496 RepID=UPI0034DF6C55